jgi:hypothetical protein
VKFRVLEIEEVGITSTAGGPELSMRVVMNERGRFDALAELWEYIGDEALIKHMELQGFEVKRK